MAIYPRSGTLALVLIGTLSVVAKVGAGTSVRGAAASSSSSSLSSSLQPSSTTDAPPSSRLRGRRKVLQNREIEDIPDTSMSSTSVVDNFHHPVHQATVVVEPFPVDELPLDVYLIPDHATFDEEVETNNNNNNNNDEDEVEEQKKEHKYNYFTSHRSPTSRSIKVDANAEDASAPPSLTLSKSIYAENESIAVSFRLGSPHDVSYAGGVDVTDRIGTWTVGLFMRDADPQEGLLSPIVGLRLCGGEGGGDEEDDCVTSIGGGVEGRVTFGGSGNDIHMEGQWPLLVSDYGTGFDAYVLDGRGAAAIGPFEFEVRDDMGNGGTSSSSSMSSSTQTRTSVASSPPATSTAMSSTSKKGGYLHLDQTILPSPSEPLEVTFQLPPSSGPYVHNSNWKIAIYMHMAQPQSGSLEPITSLKLCGRPECQHDEYKGLSGGVHSDGVARVTFGESTADSMFGRAAGWPLSVLDYGTGYDVYVLDEYGSAVLEPVTFTIADGGSAEERSGHAKPPPHGIHKYDHTQKTKSYSSSSMSSYSPQSSTATPSSHKSSSATGRPTTTLTTSKMEYAQEEPISIAFAMGTDLLSTYPDDDLATWRIGIFMRMANPQGGSLSPILSIPLCGMMECTAANMISGASGDDHSYTLVFGMDAGNNKLVMEGMEGDWPMNLLDYGTGYDVYVLDDTGSDVFGPVMFNIVSEDMM